MAFTYLKNRLRTGKPEQIILVKRWKKIPKKDYVTKQEIPNEYQYPYDFQMSDKELVKHYANQREEEVLSTFKENESLQVVRQESIKDGDRIYWNEFTPTEGVEARLAENPPLRSNVQQATHDKHREAYDLAREIHDWKLGLAGIVQSMLIAGASAEQVKRDAPVWAEWIRTKAKEMAEKHESANSHPQS